MVCGSCKSIVDDCWRWCPQCGGQLTERVLPGSWEQDFYSVEWIIETEPAEPAYEFSG